MIDRMHWNEQKLLKENSDFTASRSAEWASVLMILEVLNLTMTRSHLLSNTLLSKTSDQNYSICKWQVN